MEATQGTADYQPIKFEDIQKVIKELDKIKPLSLNNKVFLNRRNYHRMMRELFPASDIRATMELGFAVYDHIKVDIDDSLKDDEYRDDAGVHKLTSIPEKN
jgi:hypothetical protein